MHLILIYSIQRRGLNVAAQYPDPKCALLSGEWRAVTQSVQSPEHVIHRGDPDCPLVKHVNRSQACLVCYCVNLVKVLYYKPIGE